jgi:hypothetical protein
MTRFKAGKSSYNQSAEDFMSTQPAKLSSSLLDTPLISRIRRNHGLEHATLHILARRFPRANLAGYSDPKGYWIIGAVSIEAVTLAANEALLRLRNGEKQLALHPNCGTNLLTAGTFAGLAGAVAMLGAGRRWQDRVGRLPMAASLATIFLILSQPFGMLLQREVTTSGIPGDLEIIGIRRTQRGHLTIYRILTQG